jgi:hypothetical protein
MPNVILEEIPGYRRALTRAHRLEESWREFSYLGLSESIAGIPVGPLTWQIYRQLCKAKSPFLVGGRPFIHDVALFLFRLSPAYDAAVAAKRKVGTRISELGTLSTKALRQIARENGLLPRLSFRLPTSRFRLRRPDLITLLEQNAASISANAFKRVRSRFSESIIALPFDSSVRAINRFVDRALLDKPQGRSNKNPSLDPTDTSCDADVIHMIAGAYHWSREEILTLPMQEIFQALRNINADNERRVGKTPRKAHPLGARLTKRFKDIAFAGAASVP